MPHLPLQDTYEYIGLTRMLYFLFYFTYTIVFIGYNWSENTGEVPRMLAWGRQPQLGALVQPLALCLSPCANSDCDALSCCASHTPSWFDSMTVRYSSN